MKFSHLPLDGGIYDQHPRLIDDWEVIFSAIAKEQRMEAERQKAQAGNKR